MLIYARIKTCTDKPYKACLFFSLEQYFKATFSPLIEYDSVVFSVRGNTYQERKNHCRNIAIDYQNMFENGLSYGEISIIEQWFYVNGKRYGLLTELRENGIL